MHRSFFEQILNKWCPNRSKEKALVCVFEAVRDIPYGSTGERDPEKIVKENLGSRSGKHLLLSGLLDLLGFENKIETCLHHFNKAIPVRSDYPDRFKQIITEHNVVDFHHFVHLKRSGRWLSIDATWDCQLHNFGFPVNFGWKGNANTTVAVNPIRFYPETDDLIELKIKLINELPRDDKEIRAEFLSLLTEWLREIRSKV